MYMIYHYSNKHTSSITAFNRPVIINWVSPIQINDNIWIKRGIVDFNNLSLQ